MHPPRLCNALCGQMASLFIRQARPFVPTLRTASPRLFSSTPSSSNWLVPRKGATAKAAKGKPRCATGGSVRGTTVVWGEYGLRMKDKDRRISAAQLKVAYDTIRQRLRGMRFRLYTRVSANTGVYTSGNDQRMGKGKGSFDHWATRVAVSRIVFELEGDIHEQVVRDAFRLAGNKLPGQYEFARKGDPPVMGITKLGNGVTRESLLKPRKPVPVPSLENTAERLPASTPP